MSQSSELEPKIVRHRIHEIEVFEVTGDELDALEASFAQENRNLAFFTSTLSIFATCAIGWLTSGWALASTMFKGILAGVTFASAFLAFWFFLNWLHAAKQRPKIIQRIRERRRLS